MFGFLMTTSHHRVKALARSDDPIENFAAILSFPTVSQRPCHVCSGIMISDLSTRIHGGCEEANARGCLGGSWFVLGSNHAGDTLLTRWSLDGERVSSG
jgi:hypothetical protein